MTVEVILHAFSVLCRLQVRAGAKSNNQMPYKHRRYVIGFVPRQTEEAMSLFVRHLGHELQQMFSNGDIQIIPCPIYFFPLDTDLMSLELKGVYRDLHAVCDDDLFWDISV